MPTGKLYSLPYYHGALLDEDANKLLKQNGDFLIQTKFLPHQTHSKLYLAVKCDQRIIRVEIVRKDEYFQILQLSFPNIKSLVSYYKSNELKLQSGEKVQLKREIPRGRYQLYHNDIKITKRVGSGAYGTIYKGILLRTAQTVAVKRIDRYERSEKSLTDLMKEVRVMQLYNHVNVVKLYGFIVDRTPYLLVMEYCEDGSLADLLKDKGDEITIASRVNMTCQISRGIEYLHSKKCIHRDIAARNCLLSGKIVKLADFGLCRATVIYKVNLSKPLNVRWLAPEVWQSSEVRFSTDIYAFAITMWELFTVPYQIPYSHWKAGVVKQQVLEGYRMPIPDMAPPSIAILMTKCWHRNPNKRPDASQVRSALEKANQVYWSNEDEAIHIPSEKTATSESSGRLSSTLSTRYQRRCIDSLVGKTEA